MKTTKKIYGIILALTCSLAATLKAQNIYVANDHEFHYRKLDFDSQHQST